MPSNPLPVVTNKSNKISGEPVSVQGIACVSSTTVSLLAKPSAPIEKQIFSHAAQHAFPDNTQHSCTGNFGNGNQDLPQNGSSVFEESPMKSFVRASELANELTPTPERAIRNGSYMSYGSPMQTSSQSPMRTSTQQAVEAQRRYFEFDEGEYKAARKRFESRVSLITKALAAWSPSPKMPSYAVNDCLPFKAEDVKPVEGETKSIEKKIEDDSLSATTVSLGINSVKTSVFDPDQQAAIDAALKGESFFLTGSAGTGKSFVLKRIIHKLRELQMNVVVTASTGCAAVAIQGCTVHSASGIGLGMDSISRLRRVALNPRIMRKLTDPDVLVIDEVSMLDSIVFDKIEAMYATARGAVAKSRNFSKRSYNRMLSEDEPFGGLQVIACGDFFQLPPVAASDPKLQHLKQKFFAFESEAWERTIQRTIVLRHVHRQADRKFVGLLNELRYGVVSLKTMRVLSACRMAGAEAEIDADGQFVHYTKLFAYRAQVDSENTKRLECLKGMRVAFGSKKQIKRDKLGLLPIATVESLLKSTAAEERLVLKVGARVLCVKNVDQACGIVNGSAGIVIGFTIPKQELVSRRLEMREANPEEFDNRKHAKMVTSDGLMEGEVVDLDNQHMRRVISTSPKGIDGAVEMDCEYGETMPVVQFDNGITRTMFVESWSVAGFNGDIVAERKQIPLVLGWALTIHKAQGMTLDRVETDVGRAFDYGQVYVAMSRSRSMQGLRLTTFNVNKVMTHEKVKRFYQESAQGTSPSQKQIKAVW